MRLHVALAACAACLFASSATFAQGYAPPADNEQVIITAPHFFHQQPSLLNTPPENVSLSVPVRYGDLDLRTRAGAHELRDRIRVAADDVCRQLIYAYPTALDPDGGCYRDAVAFAMPRADAAIRDARTEYGGY
jgi:UrcA family protein